MKIKKNYILNLEALRYATKENESPFTREADGKYEGEGILYMFASLSYL